MPELCETLAGFSPTSCAKLQAGSRDLASSFGTAEVDEAARRELVAAVLSEASSLPYIMLSARIALAHPRLHDSAALTVLERLRSWICVTFPPAENIAQEAAITAGLPKVAVGALPRFSHDPK